METDDVDELKYKFLEGMFQNGKECDEIIAHLETTEITDEETTHNIASFHALMLAVRHRRLDVINTLIQKGVDPDAKYEDWDERYSLIHYASACLATDLIEYLVDVHHVNVNVVDSHGNTPVILAILNESGNTERQLETVKCLVEKGANVKHTAEVTAAVSMNLIKILKYLISCGGNLNLKRPLDYSPLIYAAQWGDVEIAKLLVEAGASFEGLEGRTLFLVAVAQNDVDMVEYCSSIAIDLDWEREALPAVNLATDTKSYGVARYLVVDVNSSLERSGIYGKTPFELAFETRDTEFIELFLSAGYYPCKESCMNDNQEDEKLQELTQKVVHSVAKRTLQDLCVFQVRRSLGKNANLKVQELPLPTQLKEIVQLNHIPRSVTDPSYCQGSYDRADLILDHYDVLYRKFQCVKSKEKLNL